MSSLHLPTTALAARAPFAAGPAVYRAGGTDLAELRHHGLHPGAVVDLRDLPDLDGVRLLDGEACWLGARTPIRALAAHPELRERFPGLVQALGGLATPQIRARATLGGSLLQDARCPYYRSEEARCLRKGGPGCAARDGIAPFHAILDHGPCIAVHPSTPALALLAFDAVVDVDGELVGLPELLGDPAAARSHALPPGALIRAALVPFAPAGERSAWIRVSHRQRAEWPLVEAIARLALAEDGTIARLVVAVGGIASQPLRPDDAAAACVGKRPDDPAIEAIFADLVADASIPQTRWRAPLVPVAIADAIRKAAS